MKSKVQFSYLSLILTMAFFVLMVVGIISLWGVPRELGIFCLLMGLIILSGLYYCPVSVEATESGVKVHRLLSGAKSFAYDSIVDIDDCYPSAGGIRLCGSGGFMGYWGYFSDILIGSYFGYYGDRSQCILIRLKNGRQYVISCKDRDKMIQYIRLCKAE